MFNHFRKRKKKTKGESKKQKDLLKTEKYEHLYQKKVMLSSGQLHVQTRVAISLILCNKKKGRLYNELNVCYYLIKIYMFDRNAADFQLLVQNKKYIYTQ